MTVTHHGLYVLPVPRHVVMTLFLTRTAVCSICVMKVLFDVEPGQHAFQINAERVSPVYPEVGANADVGVEDISSRLHLLVGVAVGCVDMPIERSVQHIVFVARVIVEAIGCTRRVVRHSSITVCEMAETVIGRHNATQPCGPLFL